MGLRIRRTFFISILIVLFACAPAFASVSFDVNGSQVKPNAYYELNNGFTYIEASIIDTIIGADVDVKGGGVIIVHNNDKLELNVDEKEARLNGQDLNLVAAPYVKDGVLMLPLRAVFENLGFEIGWNSDTNTVLINYVETRDNMSADELLVKANQIINELPSYDMEGNMTLGMSISGIEEEDFPGQLVMDSDIYGYYQKEPLAIYTKQTMNMSGLPEMPPEVANTVVEALLMNDNYYINMPEMGWVKMDLGEMGLNELMQEINNQDPATMLKQMQDFGMIANYGNDVTIDGQKYWVINASIDKDKFMNEYNKLIKDLPIPEVPELGDLLSNLDLDMKYSNFVNMDTYMTDYMDMDMTINMSIGLPEENGTEVIDMAMSMKGRFKIEERSADFLLPDVSSAVELEIPTMPVN